MNPNKWLFLCFGAIAMSFVVHRSRPCTEPEPYVFPSLRFFPTMPFAEDNLVTVQGVELGRFLFYDSILSLDYSISCASCHKQSRAFSDDAGAFSRGIDGQLTIRNTPGLFNLAWYEKLFWDGRATSIEAQVFVPVRDHREMGLSWKVAEKRISKSKFYQHKFREAFGNVRIDSVLISKAIAQFERSLISANSKYDQVLRRERTFNADEYAGFVLMNDQSMGNCLHCHTTDADALGTTGKFSNNGIDFAIHPTDYSDRGLGISTAKESDFGRFKIPSLRNCAVTAPYMHDGRFKTLLEVLDFYSEGVNNSVNIDPKMTTAHRGGVHLTETEKQQIIAFLTTLTDSSFIVDPRHANPWKKRN